MPLGKSLLLRQKSLLRKHIVHAFKQLNRQRLACADALRRVIFFAEAWINQVDQAGIVRKNSFIRRGRFIACPANLRRDMI